MEIDKDLQKLIDDYVKKIETKEGELLSFKKHVDDIISGTEKELQFIIDDLEKKFDSNEISEEEYLTMFREKKKNLLEKVQARLNSLLKEVASGELIIDEDIKTKIEKQQEDENRIEELRKSLQN